MRTFCYLMLMILAVGSLHAEIYKWTDSEGNVHFSDQPHQGSEKINLPASQTFTPPPQNNSASPPAKAQESDAERGYKVLRIAQPIDEATIRNSQGYVPVIVEISPELKSGDKLQILYDGEPLGEPQATTVFALNDVKRGSHTIAVQAVDDEGTVLSTSEMITIFMHRPRVGMVPQTKPKNTAN